VLWTFQWNQLAQGRINYPVVKRLNLFPHSKHEIHQTAIRSSLHPRSNLDPNPETTLTNCDRKRVHVPDSDSAAGSLSIPNSVVSVFNQAAVDTGEKIQSALSPWSEGFFVSYILQCSPGAPQCACGTGTHTN